MRSHPLFLPYVALAALCFFWGTTFLAIRIALESIPPLTLLCVRFFLSGGAVLAAAVLLRQPLPRGRELALTAVFGVTILGFGNGALVFAETWIPSGLAALFITTSPYWMVGLDALLPGGKSLHGPTLLGLFVGLLGVAVLLAPGAATQEAAPTGRSVLSGFLLLQVGCCGWCLGSLLQRRVPTRAHPIVGGAIQQLATGIVFLAPALLANQEPARWDARGLGALLYLATFGSIVGYSAYVYALARLPVALVSLYTYVNPAVAVALGWLFYREPFGWRESAAMLLIFLGVALVKRSQVP